MGYDRGPLLYIPYPFTKGLGYSQEETIWEFGGTWLWINCNGWWMSFLNW